MEKDIKENNEDKMKKLEETLEDEASKMLTNTSCLAIANIFIRKHPLLKILWSIAFILCSILTISQLYNLSRHYFSYPLNTGIRLKSYNEDFPSITFCNLNPLRKSKINLAKVELQNFLHNLEIKNFTMDNVNEMDTRLYDEYLFTKLILNESKAVRFQMGNQLQDFILQCYYLGQKCNLEELFTPLLSNKFGNCFTFNPTNLWSRRGNVSKSGRSNGLFITFHVRNNEYLPNFVQSTGIRIHFHERNTLEIPDIHGMTLPTGFHISLGILPTIITKLQEIKGNCENGNEFRKIYNAIYTVKACYTICLHQKIYDNCGCYDITFELFQRNITNSLCSNEKNIECMLKTTSDFNSMRSSCNCNESCNAVSYDIMQSFATWPAASYEKRFFDDLSDIYPNFQNITERDSFKTRQNFINLVVYVEDRSHKEIYQIRAYTWDSFLSEIGGTLNLYLGFCILTAFEFFESIMIMITYFCGKLIYKKND